MSVDRSNEPFRIGEWRVEPALDQLSRNGERIKLEPRAMRVLLRLSAAAGQVVSSRQLLDEVWSGVVVGPASVYQAISQLRKLLGGAAYIATVPRKGYRLIAPVRRIESEEFPFIERRRSPIMPLHRWLAAIILISIFAMTFALWLQGSPQAAAATATACNSQKSDAIDTFSAQFTPRR